jgi:hypothetical protein
MSQLTAALPQAFEVPAEYNEFGVLDNVIIYRGSAVGLSGGYARQLVAGDTFAGFAENTVDNTDTGHASGAKTVQVRAHGCVQLVIASVAVTDNLVSDIYASDGNTYTKTAGGNSLVGKVWRYISSTTAIVAFDTRVQ